MRHSIRSETTQYRHSVAWSRSERLYQSDRKLSSHAMFHSCGWPKTTVSYQAPRQFLSIRLFNLRIFDSCARKLFCWAKGGRNSMMQPNLFTTRSKIFTGHCLKTYYRSRVIRGLHGKSRGMFDNIFYITHIIQYLIYALTCVEIKKFQIFSFIRFPLSQSLRQWNLKLVISIYFRMHCT